MDKSEFGVHETHCCVKHGCKYGDKDCPVVLEQIVQAYRCQDCPPVIKDNTLELSKFISLVNSGYQDWLEINDVDKITVTHDNVVIPELTELQHEMVELIKRKDVITNYFYSIRPDTYIRKLKIKKIIDANNRQK